MPVRPFACLVGAVLAGVLGIPGGAAAAVNRGDHAGDLVVHTDKGNVRGIRAGGVDSFLGIRYAASPTGALRLASPTTGRALGWCGRRDRVRQPVRRRGQYQRAADGGRGLPVRQRVTSHRPGAR